MDYVTARTLNEITLLTLSLPPGVEPIRVAVSHPPRAIQVLPLTYSLFDRQYNEAVAGGSLHRVVTVIIHRVLFQWVEREYSEGQVGPYVDAIRAAFEGDPLAGGELKRGSDLRKLEQIAGGWQTVNGIEYRALDVVVATKVLFC